MFLTRAAKAASDVCADTRKLKAFHGGLLPSTRRDSLTDSTEVLASKTITQNVADHQADLFIRHVNYSAYVTALEHPRVAGFSY